MRHVPLVVRTSVLVALASVGLSAQAPAVRPPSPASQSGAAAQAAPLRVGVVDLAAVERAVPTSPESVQAYGTRRAAELDLLRKEIQDLRRRIAEGGDKLDDATRTSLVAEIASRQGELRDAETAAVTELQTRADAARTAVRTHIEKVAAERGVQLVLERANAAVLWHAPAIDLTSAVIDSMRKALSR